MAFSTNMFGPSELVPDDSDAFEFPDVFEFVNLDPEYIALSVFDDISTNVGSELGVPPLTTGPTLTPSTRSKASPSLDSPEDLDLHYGLDPPWPNEAREDLGFPSLDKSSLFRHMGENPEILVQDEEPLSSRPKQLRLDDSVISPSPKSPLLQNDSPSQPTAAHMKRGRSGSLPRPKRAKAASMRKIKACSWCHIHKVECDEATPCDRCRNIFPGYPNACDRARLYEIRFPDHYKSTSIWLDNWLPVGYSRTVAVNFNQVHNASPGLALTMPAYVANSSWFPTQPQGLYNPPVSRIGVPPMSTSGNWAGTLNDPWVPGNLALSEPWPAANELPKWAEMQLSIELEKYKRISFPAAVGALLLAYRDSSLAPAGPGPASGKKKSKQVSVVNTKELVRRVLEMQCWFRIWRNPSPYGRFQGRQATGQSNDTAIKALIACEDKILRDLDELHAKLTLEEELPVWACLWQMIFTYRDVIGIYSEVGHVPPSGANFGLNTVLGDVPAALATVEHLHRLLVIKHAAYVGSSSPVFHKKEHPETGALLAGDERLRSEWENVLLQREEFYRMFSEKVPSDAFFKALIIDVEANTERRRKQSRKRQSRR